MEKEPAESVFPDSGHGRLARRVAVEVQVELELDDWRIDPDMYTANISETGLFAVTGRPAPVGSLAKFKLSPKRFGEVRGLAEVVWIRLKSESCERPSGMGLSFRHVAEDANQRLREFVAKHRHDG